MSALRELYQEVIIEHSRQPRNFGALAGATHSREGYNPLCGDKVHIHLVEENDVVTQIRFEGCGCAISMASASLMTEALVGKTRFEVTGVFHDFHLLMTKGHDAELENRLGKLAVLSGVAEFPARVKCATLAWHTLKAALVSTKEVVSTE
jgi:nitrogen fixation NifU-like protein